MVGKFMFILFGLFVLASGCLKTSDYSPTTVEPTTLATTTTMDCNACMPSQVTLGPDPNNVADSHSPVVPPVVGTQNDCATLTVTCVAMTNPTTLMTFQYGRGGLTPAATVTAVLVCSTMGLYQLRDMGGPAIIAVHCLG